MEHLFFRLIKDRHPPTSFKLVH